MRGAILSTAVVALSLVLVRGGASGDASAARLRATKSAEGDLGLRQLHEEMVKEQYEHEAKRVSGEEIKALVAHRRQAHPGKSRAQLGRRMGSRPKRSKSMGCCISFYLPTHQAPWEGTDKHAFVFHHLP